ncbi:adenylate kinase, partial [Haematococcus lacustris]
MAHPHAGTTVGRVHPGLPHLPHPQSRTPGAFPLSVVPGCGSQPSTSWPTAASLGGITVTTRRMAQGALFSYPYLRTGLGVLIAADTTTTEYDKWAFLRPFSSGVWIAVVCTAVMIPIFLFLIENLTQ